MKRIKQKTNENVCECVRVYSYNISHSIVCPKFNKKLSYRRETARQLRIHAQLTRCFSSVAV